MSGVLCCVIKSQNRKFSQRQEIKGGNSSRPLKIKASIRHCHISHFAFPLSQMNSLLMMVEKAFCTTIATLSLDFRNTIIAAINRGDFSIFVWNFVARLANVYKMLVSCKFNRNPRRLHFQQIVISIVSTPPLHMQLILCL